jgi:N4-gp56 family major capsid protein|tara:strand:+ start:1960 stop:2793 length:834 start_codon:yes stop_codon:yes gene_type:complete
MALGITNAFVQLFDAEVHQAYQGARALAGVTRERTNVEGNQVKFPKIGKGTATVRVPQADVTPLNVTYSQVTATMSDFIAAEYSDIFQQQKVNFDERRELVQVVGNAIGRRMDQLVIDALNAASSPSTVATTVGGSGTNLNLAKLLAAKKALDTKNVPAEGRCAIIHANGLSALLDETELTSSDFATVKALSTGEIDTFLGFKFITIGDRDEGGLPLPSTRTSFFFHRDAVGLGIGMNQRSEINYVPEKTSFLVSSMFSAGAVAIDDEGIVKVSSTE